MNVMLRLSSNFVVKASVLPLAKFLAIAIITFFTVSVYAARPMVLYYESWSADSAANDIIELPPYVTHLMISFVKPDAVYRGHLDLSFTGLNLPYSGTTLKAAVKTAKQNNPSLRVLLAVGGATLSSLGIIKCKCNSAINC